MTSAALLVLIVLSVGLYVSIQALFCVLTYIALEELKEEGQIGEFKTGSLYYKFLVLTLYTFWPLALILLFVERERFIS